MSCHENVGSTWRTSTLGHAPKGAAKRCMDSKTGIAARRAGPVQTFEPDAYLQRAIVRSIASDLLAIMENL